jgi:hypothetical protein
VHPRLDQLRAVQPQPVDWSRYEQVQIARQEEARERSDHVREEQDAEKAHQHDAEQLTGEQGPDLLNPTEVDQQPVE